MTTRGAMSYQKVGERKALEHDAQAKRASSLTDHTTCDLNIT